MLVECNFDSFTLQIMASQHLDRIGSDRIGGFVSFGLQKLIENPIEILLDSFGHFVKSRAQCRRNSIA